MVSYGFTVLSLWLDIIGPNSTITLLWCANFEGLQIRAIANSIRNENLNVRVLIIIIKPVIIFTIVIVHM